MILSSKNRGEFLLKDTMVPRSFPGPQAPHPGPPDLLSSIPSRRVPQRTLTSPPYEPFWTDPEQSKYRWLILITFLVTKMSRILINSNFQILDSLILDFSNIDY